MPAEKVIPMPSSVRNGAESGGAQKKAIGSSADSRMKKSAQVIPFRDTGERSGRMTGTGFTQHMSDARKARKAVSVVVPTCGRVALLKRCLDALSAQNMPPEQFEVIVVDDGPQSETQSVVNQWASRMAGKHLDIIYVANNGPQHGPAAARNRGWRAAHASIIAFTDDDTVPTPGWLKNGLAAFDDTVHAVCGRIEMPSSMTPTDYERDARHLETAEFVTANCFCRKEVLDFMNGFDERFRFAWREDSDFHFRLLGLQANILYVPQAVVVHPVRPAPWGVSIAQQKKILFDALLYKKHPLLYRQKIRAAPRWDYYVIVAALLIGFFGFQYSPMLGVAGVAAWAALTARLFVMRLRGTRKSFSHIAEMLVTSMLIPPHAVFWRMAGALRFRVLFL